MKRVNLGRNLPVPAFGLAICLMAIFSSEANAQYWPGGQSGQQPGQQSQSVSGRLLHRLENNVQADKNIKAQQERDRKAQEDAQRQARYAGYCPPTPTKSTQGPEQRGKSNEFRNWMNAANRLPNGASANMGGTNNAFQNHMGAERAGFDVTGGSKETWRADTLNQSNVQKVQGGAPVIYQTGSDFAASIGGKMGPGH